MQNLKTTCLFIRGLPGSGKTTLAKNVSSVLKFVLLDPDELHIQELDGTNTGERLKNIKYRYLVKNCIETLKNNQNVIWSQPWRKIENIKITVDNINQLIPGTKPNNLSFVVAEIVIDKDLSWKRCSRKFDTRELFNQYVDKYQSYNLNLPYIRLDGNQNSQKITSELLSQLVNLNADKS